MKALIGDAVGNVTTSTLKSKSTEAYSCADEH